MKLLKIFKKAVNITRIIKSNNKTKEQHQQSRDRREKNQKQHYNDYRDRDRDGSNRKYTTEFEESEGNWSKDWDHGGIGFSTILRPDPHTKTSEASLYTKGSRSKKHTPPPFRL
jgi:hypothetical protein